MKTGEKRQANNREKQRKINIYSFNTEIHGRKVQTRKYTGEKYKQHTVDANNVIILNIQVDAMMWSRQRDVGEKHGNIEVDMKMYKIGMFLRRKKEQERSKKEKERYYYYRKG